MKIFLYEVSDPRTGVVAQRVLNETCDIIHITEFRYTMDGRMGRFYESDPHNLPASVTTIHSD